MWGPLGIDRQHTRGLALVFLSMIGSHALGDRDYLRALDPWKYC